MNKLFFLIGASGAGKTTAAKALGEMINDFRFCYLDSIGIPSNAEMIQEFGSGENWQKVKTIEWTKNIKANYLAEKPTVLDGQTRPEFIRIACQENGVDNYAVILFDCNDELRKNRLAQRGQPELATSRMMNWARFLREECRKYGYPIIDTSEVALEEMAGILRIALVFDDRMHD